MLPIWLKSYGNCWDITRTLAFEPWPEVIEEYLKVDVFDYPVSFNGKMRFKIGLPADMEREDIIKAVMADERSAKWIGSSTPSNIIVVPKKIVNVVIKYKFKLYPLPNLPPEGKELKSFPPWGK